MASALKFVKDVLTSLAILVSMFFSPYSAEPYEAKKPDEAMLVFNAVADVHVETNNVASYQNFEKVLRGLKANKSGDATVFLGDNTMNDQEMENFLFFGGVSSIINSKTTFVALGNHDIGNGTGDYNENLNRYIRYNNALLKNKIEKPYYYRVVNGYYMIFLASEKLLVHSFYMSDEQIEWFKSTMELAGKSEKPIFVFSHHPLDYIENENSNLLFDICSSYDNVYSLHGHTHWSYDIYTQSGITCINLPRVTETVDYAPGTGVAVEVYNDEIIFRERDFYNNQWLSETAFPLSNSAA